MKQFEIMYSNGKLYSGETLSDWNSCPPTGVQNVTVLHDDGCAQERIDGWDYYILDDDNQVVGTNVLIPGSVKEGELLNESQYVFLRDSVFQGGKSLKPGVPVGVSRIWNRTEDTPWEVGVRDAVKIDDGGSV